MPENTIGEKISKQRAIHHMERSDLAKLINCHIDTLESWEKENVPPKVYNIEKMCKLFNIQSEYFHEYYGVVKEATYVKKILEYKNRNKLSYKQLGMLLDVSESSIKRVISKKLMLSPKLFDKLKYNKIL